MRDVDKDDAGDITCELSNSKGKEAATAKLRVQSKHIYRVHLTFILSTSVNSLTQ